MNTIVSLVDFSDITPRLIEQSERFAKAFNSRVILVHVVPRQPVVMAIGGAMPNASERSSQDSIQAYHKRLSALGDLLIATGITVLIEQLTDPDIHNALNEFGKWNPDLVIVGSHHHSVLYNWLVGSFSSEVLKVARCPVLVVPAIPVQGAGEGNEW